MILNELFIKTAYAQGSIESELGRLSGLSGGKPWPYQNISQFISNLITFAVAIAGVGSFILLLYGGIRYISSAGDKTGTQSAKETITAAIVGLVIVVGSYTIATTLGTVLGFDPVNITIPSAPISENGGGGDEATCTSNGGSAWCQSTHTADHKPVTIGCSTAWSCEPSSGDAGEDDGCLEKCNGTGCVWDSPQWNCCTNTGGCP